MVRKISDEQFHRLLMYTGPLPGREMKMTNTVKIIHRCLTVLAVSDMRIMPNPDRPLDKWINTALAGIDLVFTMPKYDERYRLAIEYVEALRKRHLASTNHMVTIIQENHHEDRPRLEPR